MKRYSQVLLLLLITCKLFAQNTPSVIVTAPQTGTTLTSGSSYTIAWTVNSGSPTSFDLYYSTNDGSSWSTITNGIGASSRTYPWNPVPSVNSSSCKIRIVTFYNNNTTNVNNYSGLFTIQQNTPSVTVTAPQNGATLTASGSYKIKWDVISGNNLISSFKLFYSIDNGTNWNEISVSLTSAVREYLWNTIPNVSSSTCKIKLVTYYTSNKTIESYSGIFTISKGINLPILIVDDIVPDSKPPYSLVKFSTILDLTKPELLYVIRDSIDITNGNINLDNYSCILITNNVLNLIKQPSKFENKNLIIYEYQNNRITLPSNNYSVHYDPYQSKSLYSTQIQPPNSDKIPIGPMLNIKPCAVGEMLGIIGDVAGLETGGANAALIPTEPPEWMLIGIIQSITGAVFMVSVQSCIATFAAGGGTCYLAPVTAATGIVWGLTTIAKIINCDGITIENRFTANNALWMDIMQHRLHFAGSTIDCNYYFTYDDHLQYPVCKTTSENIFQNSNSWGLTAQGSFNLNTQGDLVNNGQLSIRAATPQEVQYRVHGDHSQKSLRKSDNGVTNLIALDLEQNTFTYSNFSCQVTDNTTNFQPELIIARDNDNGRITLNANPDYCSADFMLDSSDFVSTIASVTFTPASPSQGTVDNPFHLQAQVGISTGQPGILQLMIGDSVSYQSILGRQSTLAIFNFDLLSSTQNLRTYPVNVQFRPYATVGPLLSSNLSDVIMTTNYQIDWTITDIFDFEHNKIPTHFDLYDACPNPFNPTTTINYSVPKTSFVTIKVYNVLGRETAILVNEEKPAGNYKIEFNASKLSSGVYFYIMKAENYFSTKKLVLIK